jgi:hypothetical protein
MIVYLQDENGNLETKVSMPMVRGFLSLLEQAETDHSYQLVQFIDPYGDTVFNRIQMDAFLEDWEKLFEAATAPELREYLLAVKALAERCRDEVHLYLKFIGD